MRDDRATVCWANISPIAPLFPVSRRSVTNVLVLNTGEVEELLDPDQLREALVAAFRDLSAGTTSIPARVVARSRDGLLAAMPAYLPAAGLVTKLVSVFPDNQKRGLPSHQAVICTFDAASGQPVALMDGTHITAMRTAAASAVAARLLAAPGAGTLAILGAGVQGASHLDALGRVFNPREIRVASRRAEHAEALAQRHSAAVAVQTFMEAVAGADIVACCTDSADPVIKREWLSDGCHVSSVGMGAEVDQATIAGASIFVEWRGAATHPPPAGAAELQGSDGDSVVEIGEVLLGVRPGRTSEKEITVYKSTGHAVEDAAAAGLVYKEAKARGIGTFVSM